MDKLERAEELLRSIAIDIDEFFDNKPQKAPLKKITVKKHSGKKKAKANGKNSKALECKYCGSNGFVWGETNSGWRLFDKRTGAEHECKGA